MKVNYEGKLIDGTVFDSSYKRNKPITFSLNGVIPCWTEGVQKMKVGGTSQLVCPSSIAYGDRGRPPQIPGGATLTFKVELLSIEPPGAMPPGMMGHPMPGMPAECPLEWAHILRECRFRAWAHTPCLPRLRRRRLRPPRSNRTPSMWTAEARSRLWSRLDEPWDLVIIGGGITGAGVLAEASRRGLKSVLVEAGDFSSGTSSRSSKLVHGGLRYLRQAKLLLTRVSVNEREELLRSAEGLVWPLGFYLANLKTDHTAPWMFGLGLAVYDIMARKWAHTHLAPAELIEKVPVLKGARCWAAITSSMPRPMMPDW